MLIKIVVFLIIFYLLLLVFLFLKQKNLVYYPLKKIEQTPTDIGLKFSEEIIKTKDGINIFAWYIPSKMSDKVVLFFHGNAGNVSNRLDFISILNEMGFNILIIDYRGYGQSESIPSEKGTYLDAEASWDFLITSKKVKEKNIIIWGRSLGGAIAAYLASKKNPGFLIIESSFTCIPEMGKKMFPFLPVKSMSRFRYDTKRYIQNVKSPILIIHSPKDEVVPYSHGEKLFTLASEPKEFLIINGSHNYGFIDSQAIYIDGVKNFLEKFSNL